MKSTNEKLSIQALQALADQYGGMPKDKHRKDILAPVLRAIPKIQRQLFFEVLDSRRSVSERTVLK